MQDAVVIALAKTLEKQAKPIKLAPGDHQIDETVTLRITGRVRKGEDNEFTPTVEIPMLATMALLLEKSGFQRERSKALLIEAMQEALDAQVVGNEKSAIIAERVNDIQTAMEHVQEITAALPKKMRSGTTTMVVELIDTTPMIVNE